MFSAPVVRGCQAMGDPASNIGQCNLPTMNISLAPKCILLKLDYAIAQNGQRT